MTLDDAMELVQRRRPEVDPIPAFLNMLRDYELQCRSQGDIASDSATKKFGNKRAAAVVGPSGPSPNRSRPRIGPSLPPPAIVGHEPRRNFEEPQASDVAAPSSVDEPHAVYRSAEDVAGEFSSEKT